MGYNMFGYQDIIGTEFAGAEDIIGADDDLLALLAGDSLSVFGADPAAMAPAAPAQSLAQRVQSAAAKKAFVQQLALRGNGAAVVTRGPSKSRKYAQGFCPTVINAGATVNIIVQPQVTFKGKRLFIPSDFAGAILVNDLKIGNTSQLPSSNPLPGRAFTEFAVGVEQDFDTAQISQQISLSVTNTSGAAVTFTAMLNGIVVQ